MDFQEKLQETIKDLPESDQMFWENLHPLWLDYMFLEIPKPFHSYLLSHFSKKVNLKNTNLNIKQQYQISLFGKFLLQEIFLTNICFNEKLNKNNILKSAQLLKTETERYLLNNKSDILTEEELNNILSITSNFKNKIEVFAVILLKYFYPDYFSALFFFSPVIVINTPLLTLSDKIYEFCFI